MNTIPVVADMLKHVQEAGAQDVKWADEAVMRAKSVLLRTEDRFQKAKDIADANTNGVNAQKLVAIVDKLTELGVTKLRYDKDGRSWRGIPLLCSKVVCGKMNNKVACMVKVRTNYVMVTLSVNAKSKYGYGCLQEFLTLRYQSKLTVANKELDLLLKGDE